MLTTMHFPHRHSLSVYQMRSHEASGNAQPRLSLSIVLTFSMQRISALSVLSESNHVTTCSLFALSFEYGPGPKPLYICWCLRVCFGTQQLDERMITNLNIDGKA